MINDFKYIKEKTLELESTLEELKNEKNTSLNNFKSISKNLLNYSITDESEIELYSFYLVNDNSVLFNLNIDFYLASSQNLEFQLIVNNICIYKTNKYFNYGNNNITINKDYTSLNTGEFLAKIKIKSLDKKQIEINKIELIFYGVDNEQQQIIYHTTEIEDNKLLLSYLYNEELYYLIVDKNVEYYNYSDFKYLANAKSYSFTYDNINNKILFLKINKENKLILNTLYESNEKIIDTNVNKVSCSFGNNKVLVCYLKNNKCYYLSIQNNIPSNTQSIHSFQNLKNITTSYNKHSDKFYIVLTDFNNQNYLIESIDENLEKRENIKVNLDFTIETYEVDNEI